MTGKQPKGWTKVLAWVLVLVGFTVCVTCGGQALWLAQQGGYTNYGPQQLMEQGEQELLEDRLVGLVSVYESSQRNDTSMELTGRLRDNNFFFTIKTLSGATLLASEEQGEYREKMTWQGEVLGKQTEETITRYYATPEAREQGMEMLRQKYDDIYNVEYYDTGSDPQERAMEPSKQAAEGRYVLRAECVTHGPAVAVEITGYLRQDLEVNGGDIYGKLMTLTQLSEYRYSIAAAALIGGVLGALGLIYLVKNAGRSAKRPGEVMRTALDRVLPLDLLAVLAVVGILLSIASLDTGPNEKGLIPLYDILLSLVVVALLVTGLLSFVRQEKTGEWKNTLLCRRLIRPAAAAWRKGKDVVCRTAGKLPLFWVAGLGFLGLCFLEGLCLLAAYYGNGVLLLWLLLKGGEGCLLIYLVLAMRELQTGAHHLAAGQLEYQVPTDRLFGPFRAHGEDLNNLRQGIQHAVEEQMKSERMKTELITNVSHDIKTPLTSIVNYVDLLKKEPMPDAQAKQYLEVLDRQSARLKKLTEDLVEASKASTGNLTVDLQPTDVNVLMTQTVGEYEEKLSERDLTLVLTPAESSPKISADGRLLWRVFENLFSNIQKYALPGTRVYLTCEATAEQVSIAFRNISAIPLNISAQELMERFVRGDASRNTEGSGLGLSIARSLTQIQKGDFSLTIDGDLFKAVLTFPRLS